jgi:hypothetical protein
MTRTIITGAIAVTLATAALADAPGGPLGTLPIGEYVCSLPGDAGGKAWEVVPEKGFTIGNASTYHTETGSGTYLLAGDQVRFTRGPMKGMRFERTGHATLRWLDENGERGRVRCIRNGATR